MATFDGEPEKNVDVMEFVEPQNVLQVLIFEGVVIRLILNYSKRTNKCKKSISLVTVCTKLTDLQCSERMPGAIQSIRK